MSHSYLDSDIDMSKQEDVIDSDNLPVIDFQCINEEKQKLHEACMDWGIFRLVNHGIPSGLLNQLHETSKQLFHYSFESKQGLFSSSPITYFRGTPALDSQGRALQPPQNVECMEGFNVPLNRLLNAHASQDDDASLPASFRFNPEHWGEPFRCKKKMFPDFGY